MADALIRVRVTRATYVHGRPTPPGIVEVPALLASELIASSRGELVDPAADEPRVRQAVQAENARIAPPRGLRAADPWGRLQ